MSRTRVVRVGGHPLHAALTAFPVGLLATTPVWDTAALVTATPALGGVAYWCLLLGLVAAAAAALVGLLDLWWLSESSAQPPSAMRHALWHAGLAVTATTLFLAAYLLRRSTPDQASALVLALEWVGVVTLLAAGWFGGHLVFHHGLGVERNASTEPALPVEAPPAREGAPPPGPGSEPAHETPSVREAAQAGKE